MLGKFSVMYLFWPDLGFWFLTTRQKYELSILVKGRVHPIWAGVCGPQFPMYFATVFVSGVNRRWRTYGALGYVAKKVDF